MIIHPVIFYIARKMFNILCLFLSLSLILFFIPVYGGDSANPRFFSAQDNSLPNLSIYSVLAETNQEDPKVFSTITIPRTPASKTPVIRYTNSNLPDKIRSYVDHIDFQTRTTVHGQVYIYFFLPAGSASMKKSGDVTDFILSRSEWAGDRSRPSVQEEIYFHWIAENLGPLFQLDPKLQAYYKKNVIGNKDTRNSPVHPIHLGYFYAGLDDTPYMDPYLKKI